MSKSSTSVERYVERSNQTGLARRPLSERSVKVVSAPIRLPIDRARAAESPKGPKHPW